MTKEPAAAMRIATAFGLLCLALATPRAARAADAAAEASRRGGDQVAHWHFGPFFDYRRAEPGSAEFLAFRPFYSQVTDPASDTTVRDFLWPLGTWHDARSAHWWRALLLAYGDGRDGDPSCSFNVFPIWFSGVDRAADGYWGLFPVYGRHPHVLTMDDWEFALWPLWHTYTVKGVRSHAVLWPFVTWRDAPREGIGVWPLYGYGTQRESEHSYFLWPLFTWASYREDRDTSGAGSSWMFLPLYGQVRRARESQTMLLPPFFSYVETDSATRWRLPWPLVEVLRSNVRDRVSVWPFYEGVDSYSYLDREKSNLEEKTWRVGWQLVEDARLETKTTLEERFTFFPFFTNERRFRKTEAGLEETSSYFRVWPFYSSSTENGLTRRRVLDLIPIRHSGGLDRNWAPFWTLWESTDCPGGKARHLFLFNLIPWTSQEDR